MAFHMVQQENNFKIVHVPFITHNIIIVRHGWITFDFIMGTAHSIPQLKSKYSYF